jgi:hypothetical protein
VGDDNTRGDVVGKAGHPPDKPAMLVRRMAGIFERELHSPPVKNRAYPLRERGSVLITRRRFTHPEVVGTLRNVPNGTVGGGEVSPGFVNEDDGARPVEDRDVRGEAVQYGASEGRGRG